MNNQYKLIVLCGKAGVGKDFLLQQLCKAFPDDLNIVVSDTTRPPRWGEENGVNYNFLTEKEFHKRDHIEHSYFNRWYYGTPIDSLSTEKINVLILNPDGVRQIYTREDLKIRLFLISASDKTRMLRQLNREDYPDVKEVCRRFLADEEDFMNLYKYPFKKLRNQLEGDEKQCLMIIKEVIDELKNDSGRIN